MIDYRNPIYELFMPLDQRGMDFGTLPIAPKTPDVPIIVVDRWKESGGALYKTYTFRRPEDRNDFVIQLLAYEVSTQHRAEITIIDDQVSLKLQTKDLGKATEIDKEHARYADVLFRGIVYSSTHGE